MHSKSGVETIPESALNFVKQFQIVEDEVLVEVLPVIGKTELKKKEYLLKNGEICKNFYFIEKGALKHYYTQEDKDITTAISFENEFITSGYSFLSQKKSWESIVAIEDCILYYLSFEDCFYLMKKYHSCSLLGAMLTMHSYLKTRENEVNILRHTNALDRYKFLLETQPQIFQRCRLTDIASLLGISLETLSRLRAKKE